VISSAIAEYEDGYLIGTRTCGCLSVGQTQRLPDNSEIVVTVQQALTGRYERSLEGRGLDPDEVVRPATGGTADPQLARALEYLAGRLP
jgi:C-terminal processing protease CtpA/Prc